MSGPDDRQGLAPVVGAAPRMLVLGSMPGNASLAAQRYYAHPRNQFWPIMAELVGARGSYEERLDRLMAQGIALWDVLDRCVRPGSLDAAIRDEVPNDFAAFLAIHPSIEAIVFNGGKAASIWARHVAGRQVLRPVMRVARLPSTSPAHAGMPLRDKIEAWRAMLDRDRAAPLPSVSLPASTNDT